MLLYPDNVVLGGHRSGHRTNKEGGGVVQHRVCPAPGIFLAHAQGKPILVQKPEWLNASMIVYTSPTHTQRCSGNMPHTHTV